MKCEDFENLISAYADDELENPERILVEAHIQQCESCRDYYEQMVLLQQDIYNALTNEQCTCDLVSKVVPKLKPKHSSRYSWVWIPAAAVLIFAVCFVAFIKMVTPKSNTPLPAVATHQQKRVQPVKTPVKKIANKPDKHTTPKPPEKSDSTETARTYTRKNPVKTHIPLGGVTKDPYEAEIDVKYYDFSKPGNLGSNENALPSAEIPTPGPGQTVVAENYIEIIDGKRVQKVGYRIVDTTDTTPRSRPHDVQP